MHRFYAPTGAGSHSHSSANVFTSRHWQDKPLPMATTPAARLARPIGERLDQVKAVLLASGREVSR